MTQEQNGFWKRLNGPLTNRQADWIATFGLLAFGGSTFIDLLDGRELSIIKLGSLLLGLTRSGERCRAQLVTNEPTSFGGPATSLGIGEQSPSSQKSTEVIAPLHVAWPGIRPSGRASAFRHRC